MKTYCCTVRFMWNTFWLFVIKKFGKSRNYLFSSHFQREEADRVCFSLFSFPTKIHQKLQVQGHSASITSLTRFTRFSSFNQNMYTQQVGSNTKYIFHLSTYL